jgi:hypothetical protein
MAISMSELRGFAPIGMLELWNTGIMGFGELTGWVIGEIKLTNQKRNEKFGSNPFGRRRIYIIPLFHHSIIPCVRQDCQASVNFNKLHNYRDVYAYINLTSPENIL